MKELKAILRENNLTVSGTKEALIERLMQHHREEKPKPKPGKLKVNFQLFITRCLQKKNSHAFQMINSDTIRILEFSNDKDYVITPNNFNNFT